MESKKIDRTGRRMSQAIVAVWIIVVVLVVVHSYFRERPIPEQYREHKMQADPSLRHCENYGSSLDVIVNPIQQTMKDVYNG